MAVNGKVIGIDLGTTFSAMAYLDRQGSPVTIPNAEGELTTPSVVLFEENGSVVVGREARRAALVCPERVAACVKRDMGEKFYNQAVAGRRLSPSSISALILKKLHQDAQNRIGPIAGAVITVPAYFDETRRQATADAGAMAGLQVLDILNEPTSAALAYAFRQFVDRGGGVGDIRRMAAAATAPSTAIVYDLGGGTFDVTIIRIQGKDIRVLATDGDVCLGGKDWDERIVNYAAELFVEQHGNDPRQDAQSHQDLILAAEEAKKDLSRRENTTLAVNHFGRRVLVKLSRDQFEEMSRDLLFRTESRVDRVVRQAKLRWSDINQILLVGGSSRMPQVAALLRRLSGQEPNGMLSVDEVVAHGAAIHGAILQVGGGKAAPCEGEAEALVLDPDEDDAPAAEILSPDSDPATPVPLEEYSPVTEESPPAQQDVAGANYLDPFDEEVTDLLRNVTTVNVNAHSLGVVVSSRRTHLPHNSILIERNTPLPASRTKVYGTAQENQAMVKVEVLEGESEDPQACVIIGECVISPLPAGLPKGSPIQVTFSYDNSGRLHVRAKDQTSGLTAKSTIIRATALTQSEMAKARSSIARIAVS